MHLINKVAVGQKWFWRRLVRTQRVILGVGQKKSCGYRSRKWSSGPLVSRAGRALPSCLQLRLVLGQGWEECCVLQDAGCALFWGRLISLIRGCECCHHAEHVACWQEGGYGMKGCVLLHVSPSLISLWCIVCLGSADEGLVALRVGCWHQPS